MMDCEAVELLAEAASGESDTGSAEDEECDDGGEEDDLLMVAGESEEVFHVLAP